MSGVCRRRGLLLNNLIGIGGAVLMGFSNISGSYEMLILGRLVIGVNCGEWGSTDYCLLTYLRYSFPITLETYFGYSFPITLETYFGYSFPITVWIYLGYPFPITQHAVEMKIKIGILL